MVPAHHGAISTGVRTQIKYGLCGKPMDAAVTPSPEDVRRTAPPPTFTRRAALSRARPNPDGLL